MEVTSTNFQHIFELDFDCVIIRILETHHEIVGLKLVECCSFSMREFQTIAKKIDELVRVSVLQEPYVLDCFSWICLVSSRSVGFLQLRCDIDQDSLRMNQTAYVLPLNFLLAKF